MEVDAAKLMRVIIAVSLCALAAACGPLPEIKERPKPVPTSTPINASPEAVQKATNVSFNTYSKEWPVNWQWIDPDWRYAPTGRDITKGVLELTVPKGKDLTDKVRTASRFIKAISGDFAIEARVRFRPAENFQGAGLLMYQDDLNYIRFLHAFGGEGGGGAGLLLDLWRDGVHETITTTADIQTEAPELDLRLIRTGTNIFAYWRLDEESEWREAGSTNFAFPASVLTGLVACNTARETTMAFEHIRLLPSSNK